MLNDPSSLDRDRRFVSGVSSSDSAKLVNLDVWYATTLWVVLITGWLDPDSGRKTRNNPAGSILIRPVTPPALLIPPNRHLSYSPEESHHYLDSVDPVSQVSEFYHYDNRYDDNTGAHYFIRGARDSPRDSDASSVRPVRKIRRQRSIPQLGSSTTYNVDNFYSQAFQYPFPNMGAPNKNNPLGLPTPGMKSKSFQKILPVFQVRPISLQSNDYPGMHIVGPLEMIPYNGAVINDHPYIWNGLPGVDHIPELIMHPADATGLGDVSWDIKNSISSPTSTFQQAYQGSEIWTKENDGIKRRQASTLGTATTGSVPQQRFNNVATSAERERRNPFSPRSNGRFLSAMTVSSHKSYPLTGSAQRNLFTSTTFRPDSVFKQESVLVTATTAKKFEKSDKTPPSTKSQHQQAWPKLDYGRRRRLFPNFLRIPQPVQTTKIPKTFTTEDTTDLHSQQRKKEESEFQ